MSNPPPPSERTPPAPQGRARQVALSGAQQKRRGGLFLFGLVLVLGAGFGFWFMFRSIDERSEYLMAARTIQRWEIARAEHFTVVEANVGSASALTPDRLSAVSGRWATGPIPAGTIINEGLFETPPLSSESEADKVLLRITLPSAEAPSGGLNAGDTVALMGRESSDQDGGQGEMDLIGVLRLEFVQGDEIHYVVTPQEAQQIEFTVDRYNQASQRRMWKLGFGVTAEDLVAALGQQSVVAPAPDGIVAETGSGSEPVEDQ